MLVPESVLVPELVLESGGLLLLYSRIELWVLLLHDSDLLLLLPSPIQPVLSLV